MYCLGMAESAVLRRGSPPPFFALAGHTVRWGLLTALARGDRRVGELCEVTGSRQSLVSYHLRRLRDAGLVRARRSLADGRDTYYALDLQSCAALFGEAGQNLHPGLGSPGTVPAAAPLTTPARVLFLCTGNSARSQMAEALAEHLSSGTVRASSAGSRPKPVHPEVLRVLRDRGIDGGARRSKHLDELIDQRFDVVITLCDRVREVCPEFPGAARSAHWSTPDPAAAGSPRAFDEVADELDTRIRFLLAELATPSPAAPSADPSTNEGG
jgi:ArsR family transcriptional regulator, arsenate/arsenite/antimonite-responsive transcriptional repressor / arsenate reductase (thioredoxin)